MIPIAAKTVTKRSSPEQPRAGRDARRQRVGGQPGPGEDRQLLAADEAVEEVDRADPGLDELVRVVAGRRVDRAAVTSASRSGTIGGPPSIGRPRPSRTRPSIAAATPSRNGSPDSSTVVRVEPGRPLVDLDDGQLPVELHDPAVAPPPPRPPRPPRRGPSPARDPRRAAARRAARRRRRTATVSWTGLRLVRPPRPAAVERGAAPRAPLELREARGDVVPGPRLRPRDLAEGRAVSAASSVAPASSAARSPVRRKDGPEQRDLHRPAAATRHAGRRRAAGGTPRAGAGRPRGSPGPRPGARRPRPARPRRAGCAPARAARSPSPAASRHAGSTVAAYQARARRGRGCTTESSRSPGSDGRGPAPCRAPRTSRPAGGCACVTGSLKSPPGGETAPTSVTRPVRSGAPTARARAGPLVEAGQPAREVGRVALLARQLLQAAADLAQRLRPAAGRVGEEGDVAAPGRGSTPRSSSRAGSTPPGRRPACSRCSRSAPSARSAGRPSAGPPAPGRWPGARPSRCPARRSRRRRRRLRPTSEPATAPRPSCRSRSRPGSPRCRPGPPGTACR